MRLPLRLKEMSLHLAEERKETPSLCFVQALEPGALRVVNRRPKAIGGGRAVSRTAPAHRNS